MKDQFKPLLFKEVICLAPYRHQVRVVAMTFEPETALKEPPSSRLGRRWREVGYSYFLEETRPARLCLLTSAAASTEQGGVRGMARFCL